MHLLIVDDDPDQLNLLQGFLQDQDFEVHTADSAKQARQIFSEQPVQIVLLDQRMPDRSGEELLAEFMKINPLIRAVMITAYATVETAVQVMKLGAVDFLEKPVDLSSLKLKLQSMQEALHIEQEAAEVAALLEDSSLPLPMIGSSPAMQQVFSLVKRLAPTPWTVLVSGETGTGKGLLAKMIHDLSSRREEPFIGVNCAAIPENLFESELFGHVKGAFTGAEKNKKGRFELAQAGTLFLDEIGELPESLQAKLLQTLQESIIYKVGSETPITVDVRLIAASNRDLKHLVEQGRFREDLFYRLNVLSLELPSLRERREDIPDLITHFCSRYAPKTFQLTDQAITALVKYNYPGNVRELEHLIQRLSVFTRSPKVRLEDLPEEVRLHSATSQGKLKQRLESVEREMINQALMRHKGNQSRAAEELGISERVIRYKMRKYKLSR